ncbi:DNA polymerase III, subunits gamma and tau [Candidatus Arthromitus sp. SFB-mouse-Japan]|uniref:DNA polymerase III subunit gamma/tau n=1 Tax=Candidatus Arthromitus sp. SFB-mouse TaxID=49118 RepID=UPI00021B7FF4|nr:DNA polymerase III subunit gamma/tau [Candidatus Arthromitus sp. SFB-mouse]EIA22366.1 DNA polymerase III, subunits gamma and tau [Candidatus Arthromitus sp. SFB-1]EIA26454.1 DNA polymerase III, subunits gamma and tau [Candidatus Arthromitus sp. SFB-5]EIA28719.1 DNA polymerase III, subunits gamma and tau [Candidatus Arthromitus sp. SFB-co]EIA31476.1 DNA polymerase III, subunits gamma and tau [Candidatus Arthromitus sp. SFB-mouse-SU]EGX28019.1 DNA polymerase III subunit gamma/tau [Candidatus 
MDNNSLYIKYRPVKFKDICGQENVSSILKNQVKSHKFSHAYLFSGIRGTGKTTCARIFAKAINCINNVNGEPCYECRSCNSTYEILNIVELDAASNNSVDQIRTLVEELRYSNFVDGYKVYILDEVHMLSISAFNALLKSLEEPPSNVVFILSTTEIKKIPKTIISRCQKFEFKNIDNKNIIDRLKYIVESENISIDFESISLISKLADGSMRDAISILERVMLSADNITFEHSRRILGITSSEMIFDIIDNLRLNKLNKILLIISKIFEDSLNIKSFINDFRNVLRDIMFLKINKENLNILIEKNSLNIKNIMAISEILDFDYIYMVLSELNKINDMGNLSDIEYRVYLEMLIVRIVYDGGESLLNKSGFDLQSEVKKSDFNDTANKNIKFDKWNDFLKYLKMNKHMVLYSLLTNGDLKDMSSDSIVFKCNTEGILNRLKKRDTLREIKTNLFDFFGGSIEFELFFSNEVEEDNIQHKLKGYFGDEIEIQNK